MIKRGGTICSMLLEQQVALQRNIIQRPWSLPSVGEYNLQMAKLEK